MASFEELGLRADLLQALDDDDITTPTALQEAVIPAGRRGTNLVARASAGSGKTLAYALGVLDSLGPREEEDEEEDRGVRALFITPTIGDAERIAITITPYAQALGHSVAAPGSAWGVVASEGDLVVTSVTGAMEAIGNSTLKLEKLESIVIDGADGIVALGDGDVLDSLFDLVPRDAQRIVLAARFTAGLDDLVDRRVKRALRYPAEPAIPSGVPEPTTGSIHYLVASEGEKLRLLATQLAATRTSGVPPVVFCATDERCSDLAEKLSNRGFVIGSPDDSEADIAFASSDSTRADLLEDLEDENGSLADGPNQTISFDVPFDGRTLLARHGGDTDAIVVVIPRELPHLREIAKQSLLKLEAITLSPVNNSEVALQAFRDEIRQAVAEEDLTAQLLVLGPLFDEFPAGEIAAAVTALLRSKRARTPAAPVATGSSKLAATSAADAGRAGGRERTAKSSISTSAGTPGPAPVTWARLYVGVGSRDDIRPGDLVGALAGEANIQGSSIGKIEIRDSFSIVEVQADVADRVISAVNGTTVKGRSVRVDYDRGGPARRPGSGPGMARRTSRPPRKP
ncbi:MAG: DEAD/DEAH box helicase [Gemmatimonadota bacterium]|jgi:ATP-dependent RNA helicase DeaD|nr:DEAD/DEAH box helicase [Gemmatimonadota bacterium]